MKITLPLLFLSLLYFGCHSAKKEAGFSIAGAYIYMENKSDTNHVVHARTRTINSAWPLPYPIYRFEHLDVNNDGKDEILVGVIKPTRFDSVSRKRIFIFKLFDGYIRPMWMGSAVGQPLEDFRVVPSYGNNLVRTMEWERDSTFLVAEYQWKSFGLHFVHYINRSLSRQQAIEQLNKGL